MLDYVPMEIIAYADEATPPEFDIVYPSKTTTLEMLKPLSGKAYLQEYTGFKATSDTKFAKDHPMWVNAPIMAYKMIEYESVIYDNYETAFYAQASTTLYRLSDSDIALLKAKGMEDPWPNGAMEPSPSFDGSNILEWAHNLGESLISENGIISVLSKDIGGYTIMDLITGNGFLIVMGWIIIKFVIPT